MKRAFFGIILIFLITANFTFAQTAEEIEKLVEEQKKTGKFYLNFQNAEISTLVKFMSELTGKNIILEPSVKGTLTVSSAKPVTKEEAWELFVMSLSLQGFGVVEEKQFVRILPMTQAMPLASVKPPKSAGEVIVYLYRGEYTNVLQLQQSIQPFISQYAKTSTHQGSNTLIIADIAKNIEKIKTILKELDCPERGFQIKVYKLEKASAENIYQTLQGFLLSIQQQIGTLATVSLNKESNSVVVAGNDNVHRLIKNVISILDSESSGAGERAFYVIPLQFISAEEIYKSIQSIFSGITTISTPVQTTSPLSFKELETPLQKEQPQERKIAQPITPIQTKEGMKIGFDRGTNSLIVYASKHEYEAVKELISKLDIRRKQVLIAASIVEMSTSSALELGARWQFFGKHGGTAFGGLSKESLYSALLSGNFILGALSEAGKSITIGDSTIFFPDLVLLFSIIEKGSGFNLISNPKVLTLDNQEAVIKVGQVIPYASGVKFDVNGMPVITYDYKEVGLNLTVTPTIASGNLRLFINLNLQEIIDYIKPQVGSLSYAIPVTSMRQINSDVVVEKGQTIIIGGLVSSRTLKTNEGVPILQDIPLIGSLFKRKTENEDKVSLFIFLTPYIIETPEELSKITQEHQKISEELKKLMNKKND